jgi:hypothetical protein
LGFCSGNPATLINPRFSGQSSARNSGIQNIDFRADWLLLGVHLERKDHPFSELGVRFRGLEDWLGHSPFDFDAIKEEGRRLEAAFVAPPGFDCQISEETRVIFDTNLSWSIGSNRFEIGYSCTVRIAPTSQQSIFWFEKKLADLASFFSLLTGEAVYPTAILGKTTTSDDVPPFIVFAPHWDLDLPRRPTGCLLWYQSIENCFGSILREWFAFCGPYRPVWSVLVNSLWQPKQFLDSHFLSIIQALEGLHRRDNPGFYVPDDVYEKVGSALEKAIPAGTDNSLRQALKEKLKWGNEFSLRRRLRELVNSLPPQIVAPVCKPVEDLPNELADARNAIAHCVVTPNPCPDDYLNCLAIQARNLLRALVLRKKLASLTR